MLIIDAHEDLAFNALADGRNYLQSALSTRLEEAGTPIPEVAGVCMLGLPEWLQAQVAVIFVTITAIPRSHARIGEPSYSVIEAAYQQALAQLNIYRNWVTGHPQMTLITHLHHLEQVLDSWEFGLSEEADKRQIGLVLLIENADLIRTTDEVEYWYTQGVRAIGPAWHSNRFTASSRDSGSLTELGRQLLAEMDQLKMILDLSHMADRACLEALEQYQGPVIASHANPRRMVPMGRLLSDEVIEGLIGRDGVIGIMPLNWALEVDWRKRGRPDVHLNRVVEAIDIVCQMAGNSRHVGVGSDFDGGQGAECAPVEIDTIADLPKLADALLARGYSSTDVNNIMSRNWQRVLLQTLSASSVKAGPR